MSDKELKNDKAKEEKISVFKAEYDELKAKADEREAFYDKYLRAHAEFENAKKRME